jgi:acyl-coenzyme A thioesterase PaaI-like protein
MKKKGYNMEIKSFQDYYPDDYAICYGCGKLNEHGHQIKSYWDGDESVCRFKPQPYHTGAQNFVYGGLIASLIDCHATGTASAAKHRSEGKIIGEGLLTRFVTAALHVDYTAPVPIDATLVLRGRVEEIKGRKITVTVKLFVEDTVCAKGRVISIEMPDEMAKKFK